MSWFGLGLLSSSRIPLKVGNLISDPPTGLAPGDEWNGIEASGFASIPTDPTRTTAKPGLHLITPDRQHFSDHLDVGVLAMANDGGTLFNTFGVARVEFVFEGRTLSVTAPSWQTIPTERGNKTYFGWWARLAKPAGIEGYAHLYVRAVPRDATMQDRVLGPYTFGLRDQPYDGTLSVQPSQAEVASERYQSIGAAMAYAKGEGWQNYRVRIDEAGIYDIPDETPVTNGQKGWCEIIAGVAGVSIGKTSYTTDDAARVETNKSPIRFRGSNLTLDLRYVTHFEANVHGNWLDGVRITTTDPLGRNGRLRGKHHASVGIGGRFDASFFTECLIEDVLKVCQDAKLARGCRLNRVAFDIFAENDCAVFNTVTDHAGGIWTSDNPGLVIRYTGSEATATVAKQGVTAFNQNEATFTITWGSNSATFETGQSEDYYNGVVGDGYTVQDLADWINALTDWSATVEDTDFADMVCAQLGLPLDQGKSFEATDAKGADLTLKVTINAHSDFYQQNRDIRENRIIAFNTGVDLQTQNFFASPSDQGDGSGLLDQFFVCNAIYNDPVAGTYYNPADNSSQFGRGSGCILSHVVFAHNSMNEKLRIRNDNANNTADAYCLFANSVLEDFIWAGGNTVDNLTVKNLHLFSGSIPPAQSTNVAVGGSMSDLFADPANGDFTPSGALLEQGFAPVIPVDLRRHPFLLSAESGDAAGAISATASGNGHETGLPFFTPAPPSETPTADLLAAIAAAGSGDSELYNLSDATDPNPELNTGTWECLGLSANENLLAQDGNANDRPAVTSAGCEFDSGAGEHVIQAITGGTYTVVMALTKASGDTAGSLVTNSGGFSYATYNDARTNGFPQGVTVDGTPVSTQTALHSALDDGAEHVVTIQGADFAGEPELVIGRTSGSFSGTIRRIAIIAHSDFPDNLANVISLAEQAAGLS